MWSSYAQVLRIPAARQIVILSVLMRIPMFGAAVVTTVHVVTSLGYDYAAAGLVGAAYTISAAISGPVRGRLLDKIGLRRTLIPSLVLYPIVWLTVPFVGYWGLMVVVVIAGLFMMPSFSIVRQVLVTAVPMERRRTALAVDAVFTELAFMIGPAVGVLAATMWNSGWTLAGLQLVHIAAGFVLFVLNPKIVDDTSDNAPVQSGFSWLTLPVVAAFIVTLAASVTIAGSDLAVVAAMRDLKVVGALGWVLAVWALGSALGGMIYGGLNRRVRAEVLVMGLGVTLLPLLTVNSPIVLAVVLFCNGFFLAPTLTAVMDQLTQSVSPKRRGEAMGWHGSVMTAGNAVGAPLVGWVIDHLGWQWAFVAAGLFAVVLGAVLLSAVMLRRKRVLRAA